MTGKTHMMFGLGCAGTVLCLTNQTNLWLGGLSLGSAAIGSIMPDIDCPSSNTSYGAMITHVPGFHLLSKLCGKVSSHRRFWHTIFAAIIFMCLFFVLVLGLFFLLAHFFGYNIYSWMYPSTHELSSVFVASDYVFINCVDMAFYFLFGFISHLIADSFNPQGVPWLFPFVPLSKKQHVPVISVRTASSKELIYRWVSFIFMIITCGYWLYTVIVNIL